MQPTLRSTSLLLSLIVDNGYLISRLAQTTLSFKPIA